MKPRKKGQIVPQLTEGQRQLVKGNITFAQNMGAKYARLGLTKGIPCHDLQQEACMGLCIAAMRYDPGKGISFRTYAYDWCRKYVLSCISNEDYVDGDADMVCDVTDDDDSAWHSLDCIEPLLDVLSPKERKVICYIYGIPQRGHKPSEPKDFDSISVLMHLHTRTVHRIYNQAMVKMEENYK